MCLPRNPRRCRNLNPRRSLCLLPLLLPQQTASASEFPSERTDRASSSSNASSRMERSPTRRSPQAALLGLVLRSTTFRTFPRSTTRPTLQNLGKRLSNSMPERRRPRSKKLRHMLSAPSGSRPRSTRSSAKSGRPPGIRTLSAGLKNQHPTHRRAAQDW